jgi:paraquat-inducible protein A
MTRVKCKYCDQLINLKNLEDGFEYHCPRCDSIIYRKGASHLIVSLLSLSSLIIFFWAIFTPLLQIHVITEKEVSFWQSVVYLLEYDIISGFFMFITIIVIPISMNLLTLSIIFYEKLFIPLDVVKRLIGFYITIKEWNMIEVYVIGLLISFVKMYDLADVTILAGFWFNCIYMVFLYLSLVLFNPYDIVHIHKRKPKKTYTIQLTFIFILLAIIFLPAANLLTMMPTTKFSVEYSNTILGGIMFLYEQGDIFIPTVIFFTSFCIPILKVLGMVVMILMAKYNIFASYKKSATKYYIITDGMGKYSFLDIYVVVLGAAYLRFGNLVTMEIGEAVVPFALVIIFTMLASKTFDTRLLWNKNVT